MRRALAFLALALAMPAGAQAVPDDLTVLPPVPQEAAAPRTPWGDPDLRATYTLDNINTGRIPFERPAALGNRVWLTEAEFAERI